VGEKRNACRVLVRKLERNRPFARSRSGWEDNIKIDVQEVGWEDVDWCNVAEDVDKWQAGLNVVLNVGQMAGWFEHSAECWTNGRLV
jgi:hypothetical protein